MKWKNVKCGFENFNVPFSIFKKGIMSKLIIINEHFKENTYFFSFEK